MTYTLGTENAAEVISLAIQTLVPRWIDLHVDAEHMERAMFSFAFDHAQSEAPHPDRTERAIEVAHHVLGWQPENIARAIDEDLSLVRDVLGDESKRADRGPSIRQDCHDRRLAVPDLQTAHTQARRRKRRRRIVAGIAAAACVLAIAAVLLPSRSTRPAAAPPQVTVQPTTPPASTTVAQPPTIRSQDPPTLVTADGTGGFAGVVATNPARPNAAVFVSSTDGDEWTIVGQLQLSPDDRVAAFERLGSHYVAWLDSSMPASHAMRIAISDDLRSWTVRTIEPTSPAPFGITYDYTLHDIAIAGNTVLALVGLETNVDFAALSLAESYTCGHEITRETATVRMCNGGTIDVLSFSAVTTLPPATSLFVSRDGAPFAPTTGPYASDTPVQLSSVNGSLGVAHPNGLRFASSPDGREWEAVSGASSVPLRVQGASTNDQGDIVGVSVARGPSLLFAARQQVTRVIPVADVTGIEPNDYTVIIASGPAGWVVALNQQVGPSWLLFSPEGAAWEILDTVSSGAIASQIIVGDEQILAVPANPAQLFTVFDAPQ